jgi:hypothetical protein
MVGARYIAALASHTKGQRYGVLTLLSAITAPFKTHSQGCAPPSHEDRIAQALDHAPPP